MSNEDNEDPERDVRKRIVSLIQATGQVRKKQLTEEELQELKTVASRLDQMLNAAADEDRQALRSAAARLDQLLADLGTGKDVTRDFKRRRVSHGREE
jgi:cell division protein ZapA (FtsZ GTPase activity inhibitor)